MWDKVRLTGYIVAVLGGLAMVLQAMGAGVYDAAGGTFDPDPISIPLLAAGLASILTSAMAAVAVFFRWGRKR